MDWALVVLILTEAPNFSQSNSHQFILVQTEKACVETITKLQNDLGKPTNAGMKVTVRGTCFQRRG